MSAPSPAPDPLVPEALPWQEPWRARGRTALAGRIHLLRVFTQSELKDKYRGTWLGDVWGYVRPLTRFSVYFLVIGVLLGLTRRVENFPIYIFSGVFVVQYFTTSLVSGTKSLAKHSAVLRKVNVPPETIPVASVVASFVRQRPTMIVLVIMTLLYGWRPNDLVALPAALAGVALLTVFVAGAVLVSSVANMYVKDTQFAIETIVMLAYWASPVIYPWNLVSERFGEGSLLTTAYLSNPVTIAMYWVRVAFWDPTVTLAQGDTALPPLPVLPQVISVALSLTLLVVGIWLVRRTEHRIASRI